MKNKPYISLVIPACNEASVIEKNVHELQEYMEGYLGEGGWEIVLVNDGSTDETGDIINRIARDFRWCKAIHHSSNYGRGKALRTGFETASGEIIVTLDSDLSYAPYHIEKMVKAIEEKNVDIVLASAYHPEGSVENVPQFRLIISRLGNFVLSRAYKGIGKFHTWTCTVRAFRSSVVKSMDLISYDKELHLEILRKANLLAYTIAEIPADLKWREAKIEKADTKKKRKSKFFFTKTSKSHLAGSFIYRPGPLFMIPLVILLAIFGYTTLTITVQVILNISHNEADINLIAKGIAAVSQVYRTATASFYVGGISLISFIQLMLFYLFSRQTYGHYVDIYSFLNKQCNRFPLDDQDGPFDIKSVQGKIRNE